jgi:AAA domain
MLRAAAHVSLGRPIGDRRVEQGKVLYFAGENPGSVCHKRWVLIPRWTTSTSSSALSRFPGYRSASNGRWEFSLIVIDSSAAYFEGEDENSNTQAGAHARRLRSLCQMPGGPCVLVACHPVKNAADDNLLPRGGGAFLNEVDSNLTARKEESAVAVHWQGKFRWPDFSDILFVCERSRINASRSLGRLIPTVIAYARGENAREEMAVTTRSQEDQLLINLAEMPQASRANLATALGWFMSDGKSYKQMATRTLKSLEKAKLVKEERDVYVLTPAGEKTLARLRPAKGEDA